MFIFRIPLKWIFLRPLLNLAKAIEGKNQNFTSGLVFRDGINVVDKGYPSQVEPLDNLPYPLRDYFPSNDNPNPAIYWDAFCQHRPVIQLQSSRGCVYRCYFCLWNQAVYNNGKYRVFSTIRTCNEIQESINKYGAKEVYFDDEDFTIDKEHLISICEEILKRNLKIKWSCMGNIENLSEDIVKTMAKSGCVGIKFGVESGSEKILKKIGKPIDLKKVKEVVCYCLKHGIKTQATFSIGLLGETKEDIKRTVRFSHELDTDSIQVSIAMPYPGTEFFTIAKEKGYLRNASWGEYDGKNSAILSNLNNIDKKIANKIRKIFLTSWFLKKITSPCWLLRHRRSIFRTLKGLGLKFIFQQLIYIVIDERNNT